MEASEETISSRREKLNAQIIGKVLEDPKLNLISRDCLLDTLQVLFDECSLESLQKYDKHIARFVEKYKTAMVELKRLRVNIADFEIKELIGRGHFGEVHVVKEKQTGDVYAMKTLRKHDSLEKTSFDIEREIMAFSNSPWITCLQYAFQDSIYLFFVMEFHPGGDLLALLYRQGGTLPESAATFYMAELILALEDLHAMGYVHRDIKPDNILLDRCGHLKLVDFGSAAKLNPQGFVDKGMPVGTPDYVAPEVLQSVEGKNSKHSGYGVSCDYWSLGVLAYELAVGKPPFSAQNATATYARIMNHTNNLKFPPDVLLTQAYISFVKSLIVEQKSRLGPRDIRQHCLFKNLHFESLRDQVPPYVPKITAPDDISNFTEVSVKKSGPNVENFKKKTQFSGRNLPFIGFTYTHGFNSCGQHFDRSLGANEEFVKNLKEEMDVMRRNLMNFEGFEDEKLNLEKKVIEKTQKLENAEAIRNKLERDLATSIADCTALRRTLEIERKDRTELERKALELIKSAKIKWETSERNKVEGLKLEINQQQEKILQLVATNTMLNEQLQRVFKLEDKHRESVEAVEQLSRRSVIGLESRLEKVNLETKNKISRMQTSLDEALQQKQALETEIAKFKNKEKKLSSELEKSRNDYEVLKEETYEMEKLVKELSHKVGDLEIETEKSDDLKMEILKLTGEVESRDENIRNLENRILCLENENKCIEECKNQINFLKSAKLDAEKKINQLESRLQEEGEKCQSLRKQMQDSETLADETQQLKELRVNMWKLEKECSNAKIDKRIVERELKEAENRIKELDEEITSLNSTIKNNRTIHESSLLELNNINEDLSLELVKLRESYKNLEDKLANERTRCEEERSIISQLKDIIKEKDSKICELVSQADRFKDELRALRNHSKSAEEEKNRAIADLQNLKKEDYQLRRDLEDTKRQLENTRMNLEALREACVLIENQVIEYENINASIAAEKSGMIENTEKLIRDLCVAKENTQEAKKMMNEEKSKRLLCETKIKRLQEDIECLQNEGASYKEQSLKYRECSNNLSEELSVAEEKISDLEVTLKSYERQIEGLVSENNLLKEEISQHFTQIASLKESNFKQKQQIKDLKSSEAVFVQKVHELESTLNSKIGFYEHRELKHESTIQQQTKLIDYLQVKLDEHTQKKKTLTGYLFGHSKKENQPPVKLPVNYKDLEIQLEKQKQISKDLQEEVFRLKMELSNRPNVEHRKIERHRSEIASPQTKFAMEQLGKSPNTNKSEVFGHNSVQRMYHNIPHRFVTKVCKTLSKCDHCDCQIILGRDMSVCSDCNVCVHPDCSRSLKGTCGLPKAYVKHFRDSLNKLNPLRDSKDQTPSVNTEGWIKVLSKKDSWEKRYACLTNQHLNIYTNPPKENGTLIDSLELNVPNSRKKVVLEPLPSEIGVTVASSDLPFVLKIEICVDSTCWPPVTVVFMALSTADRDRWFKAFQKLFCDNSSNCNVDSVLTVPDRLYVNCVVEPTKSIKVLGTDQGLYSYYNDFLLQIEGLSEVSQMGVFPRISIVVMIAHKNNVLVCCDLNHLINLTQCAPCSKPVLTHKQIVVKNLDGFHFLEVSRVVEQPMLCAATSKQVVIMKYDLDNNDFVPLRIMDTAEPVSCALFTEHSLIVGADKFFEIDLSTFKAEEFLDRSDTNLRDAVQCHKLRSFPLAIVEICDNPKEFLLCFNEFMVFVDEYGRCSRAVELRSSYVPVGCHFIKPHLYIVQFSGVEVLKLGENWEHSPRVTVEFKRMRYLGQNKRGIYVAHDSNVIELLEGKQLLTADDSISQSTDTDEESDRFSFTSSIVQSLDGNFTDTESTSEDVNNRKVTFSQTNFS